MNRLTTKNDILKLFGVIQSEYPNFTTTLTDVQINAKQNLWYGALKDYPLKAVEQALYDVLTHNPYEPKISDVTKKLEEIESANAPTPVDYWNEICDLFADDGFREIYWAITLPTALWDKAQEDLNKIFDTFSNAVQRFLGSPLYLIQLYAMDNKERGYEKARFLKAMPELMKSEEQRDKAKEFFKLMGDRKALKGGEDEV